MALDFKLFINWFPMNDPDTIKSHTMQAALAAHDACPLPHLVCLRWQMTLKEVLAAAGVQDIEAVAETGAIIYLKFSFGTHEEYCSTTKDCKPTLKASVRPSRTDTLFRPCVEASLTAGQCLAGRSPRQGLRRVQVSANTLLPQCHHNPEVTCAAALMSQLLLPECAVFCRREVRDVSVVHGIRIVATASGHGVTFSISASILQIASALAMWQLVYFAADIFTVYLNFSESPSWSLCALPDTFFADFLAYRRFKYAETPDFGDLKEQAEAKKIDAQAGKKTKRPRRNRARVKASAEEEEE